MFTIDQVFTFYMMYFVTKQHCFNVKGNRGLNHVRFRCLFTKPFLSSYIQFRAPPMCSRLFDFSNLPITRIRSIRSLFSSFLKRPTKLTCSCRTSFTCNTSSQKAISHFSGRIMRLRFHQLVSSPPTDYDFTDEYSNPGIEGSYESVFKPNTSLGLKSYAINNY